jgi:putative addiction module killer protein
MEIIQSGLFSAWLKSLKDGRAKTKIAVRIRCLAAGNSGDVKAIGGGLSEMRINEGPGYRVYYGARGDELIIILAGGDKSSQAKDIKTAQALWSQYKAQNNDDEEKEEQG